jgi:hypothetical protein
MAEMQGARDTASFNYVQANIGGLLDALARRTCV